MLYVNYTTFTSSFEKLEFVLDVDVMLPNAVYVGV